MPHDIVLASHSVEAGTGELALNGLLRPNKTLPAKLFYDAEGCRLFYRITKLPEYYLTRTELALLRSVAPEVAALISSPAALIEYGASDETKAGFLLDRADRASRPVFATYVPIDVAGNALAQIRARLARSRPALAVLPVPADFTEALHLPAEIEGLSRLGLFPGSTIGNLDPADAARFLRTARTTLGAGAAFLVGVDLRKDPGILIPAYDDAEGVTAAFNLNLLARLNREAVADFDLGLFAHRAIWNDAESRIEMHLESLREQTVHVAGRAIRFRRGETIHTENSYKHTPDRFARLAESAGWRHRRLWMDAKRLFSLHLLGD